MLCECCAGARAGLCTADACRCRAAAAVQACSLQPKMCVHRVGARRCPRVALFRCRLTMKTGVQLCAQPDMHKQRESLLPSCRVCSAPGFVLAYYLRITAMTISVLSGSMQSPSWRFLCPADGTFDAVTMGYGLRNVASIPRALEELRRVLKPGAKAAILDFNNSYSPVIDSFQVIDAHSCSFCTHLWLHRADS